MSCGMKILGQDRDWPKFKCKTTVPNIEKAAWKTVNGFQIVIRTAHRQLR